MAHTENKFDVIIAGYGPTGAVAANLLGAAGLHVLIVEPNLEIFDIPRAVHFDGEIMRIFQALQLSDEIESKCSTPAMLRFVNGRNWLLFAQDFAAIAQPQGWPANIFFRQPLLEQQLRNGVARYKNVVVKLGWAVHEIVRNADKVCVTIHQPAAQEQQTETIEAHYLLAADGANSKVRQSLDIALEDLECDEPWLVVDLDISEHINIKRDVYQICDPARPTTLVPCAGTHIRWEFMINPQDDRDDIESEANVWQFMAPHLYRLSADLKPYDGQLTRHKIYNFHALIANCFQQNRIFLLGDAAHQTPPFLGQGMCAGIRDAYNLCWKIAAVVKGQYHARILQTYTSERRPQVDEIIRSAVKHGDIIQTRNRVKAALRDMYLMLGRIFPPLVGFLKFGLAWQLGNGLFAADKQSQYGHIIGFPIPQSMVATAHGARVRFDDLLGDNFTLIGFGIDPKIHIKPFNHIQQIVPIDCIAVGLATGVEDMDKHLTNWAAQYNVALALIRPDRQIYGVCLNDQPQDLSTQLEVVLTRLVAQLA